MSSDAHPLKKDMGTRGPQNDESPGMSSVGIDVEVNAGKAKKSAFNVSSRGTLTQVELLEESGISSTSSKDFIGSDVKSECMPGFVLFILRVFTSITSVDPNTEWFSREKRNHRLSRRVVTSQFLLSLVTLDIISRAFGYLTHLELVDIAGILYRDQAFPMQPIMLSLFLDSVEELLELLTQYMVPCIYGVVIGRPITTKGLIELTLKSYTLAGLSMAVLYPFVAFWLWGIIGPLECNISATGFFILLLLRSISYSVLNQVGDTCREISMPHWLRTFRGTSFITPGWRIGGCAWLKSKATPDTLSSHILLTTIVTGGVIVVSYLGVREDNLARIPFITSVGVIVFLVGFCLISKHKTLISGLEEEPVQENSGGNEAVIVPLCKLRGFEKSALLLRLACDVTLNIASSTILTFVVLSLPDQTKNGMAVYGAISALVYCTWKIRRENQRLKKDNKKKFFHKKVGRLRKWKHIMAVSGVCLMIGASCMFAGVVVVSEFGTDGGERTVANSSNTVSCDIIEEAESEMQKDERMKLFAYIALVISLPIFPLRQIFKVDFDAFMMEYEHTDPQAVTSMQYWGNICGALLKLPMLLVNYLVVEYVSVGKASNAISSAISMGFMSTVLIVTSVYYIMCDSKVSKQSSLYHSFHELDKINRNVNHNIQENSDT